MKKAFAVTVTVVAGAAVLGGVALIATSYAPQVTAQSVVTQAPSTPKPTGGALTTPSSAKPRKTRAPEQIGAPVGHGTAYLTVPVAGISRLEIVPYSGEPDDARGTEINDDGLAGAPRGYGYGAKPGQVGNLLLTAHRTSAGAPMNLVPELDAGDRIFVDQGRYRFTYVVAEQYWIDFRSTSSRAHQESPDPLHPGRPATRAAIVLSTCATPEDHANGNYWSDQFHNPAHRIAVAGYLQSVAQSPR